MQRLFESVEIELMKVTVLFRNKLDTRAAEKTQSDQRLKQDMQQLMIQVHQKFREIDTAISSMEAASSLTAPQPAPETSPSATAQQRQDHWAAAAAQSRMSDTTPQGGTPTL